MCFPKAAQAKRKSVAFFTCVHVPPATASSTLVFIHRLVYVLRLRDLLVCWHLSLRMPSANEVRRLIASTHAGLRGTVESSVSSKTGALG